MFCDVASGKCEIKVENEAPPCSSSAECVDYCYANWESIGMPSKDSCPNAVQCNSATGKCESIAIDGGGEISSPTCTYDSTCVDFCKANDSMSQKIPAGESCDS